MKKALLILSTFVVSALALVMLANEVPDNITESIIRVILKLILLIVYVAPAIYPYITKHPQRHWIAALAILTGWTIFGWLAAIIWNFCKPNENAPAFYTKPTTNATAKTIIAAVSVVFGIMILLVIMLGKNPASTEEETIVNNVNLYYKKNLKDPGSYQSIEWSPLVREDGKKMIRNRYRAKNSFGAYTIHDTIFTLNENNDVISAIPYK